MRQIRIFRSRARALASLADTTEEILSCVGVLVSSNLVTTPEEIEAFVTRCYLSRQSRRLDMAIDSDHRIETKIAPYLEITTRGILVGQMFWAGSPGVSALPDPPP